MMMTLESIISYIIPYSVIKPHFQSQLQRRLHSNFMWWKSSLQQLSGCNPWLKVFPKCSAALWNSMLYDIYLSTGELSLIPCNLSGTVCLHQPWNDFCNWTAICTAKVKTPCKTIPKTQDPFKRQPKSETAATIKSKQETQIHVSSVTGSTNAWQTRPCYSHMRLKATLH